MTLQITSQFDSGNIEVICAEQPDDIHLRIRPDAHSAFLQWFHFRMDGVANTSLQLHIDNAGEASYAEGWHGYQCVASYDRKTGFAFQLHLINKIV